MSDAPGAARALLAAAVGLEIDQIPEDASIFTFEAWDSLAHARIVLGIEEAIGHALPPEQLFEIDSLQSIARALAAD